MNEKNPTASELGRMGGIASAARLTDAEREARARKAADVRWSEEREQRMARPDAARVVRRMVSAIDERGGTYTLFNDGGRWFYERRGTVSERRWSAILSPDCNMGTYGPGATFEVVAEQVGL